MRRSVSALLILALVALCRPVQAQDAAELRWTRVSAADLDRFEGNAGSVRVNNVAVERQAGTDPAGVATAYEFSASVANRGADRVRVYVAIVGVAQDGAPRLAATSSVDVDPRRNEAVRESFKAADGVTREIVAYYVHAVAEP